MAGVLVRLAEIADIPRLEAVERSAEETLKTLADYRSNGLVVPVALLAAMVAEELLWVAVTEGGPVGFVGCRRMDSGMLYVHEIDVARAVQRQGIGRRLMACVLEAATQRGFAVVGLTTRRDAAWNAPFYASLGFCEMTAADRAAWPALQAQLQKEIADGIDPAVRCAMVRRLV